MTLKKRKKREKRGESDGTWEQIDYQSSFACLLLC